MSNPNPIIIPTVGRVVWFYPAPKSGESGFACNESGGPYAAIIARVWNDSMVNLGVFDANGTVHSRTSVRLVQGDEAPPDSAFCGWMPFQKGQAAKQDTQTKEANGGPRSFRSHRDELEQSAAHAIATRVAELGNSGARIGHEVRQALDALMSYGAKPVEPAGGNHASRVLYPAIRNAMGELRALHPGFNEHVNRAWNYLHSAFYSESPAPASEPGLRVTLTCLPVHDDHRKETAAASAVNALRESVHEALDEGLMRHMTGATTADCAVAGYAPPHCDFGDAIRHLKAGRRVARVGWNGKGMFLLRVKPDDDTMVPSLPAYSVLGVSDMVSHCLPWIGMKTADNKLVPWLASQTDMLAVDWVLVE
ncbi:hypothetical protein FHT32_004751 [Variovorax sp. SG517]|uniref:DUF2829 domain-containing protein n=1 Tax=Variovorax sp. SG517 TaxID=2587117 RepID=UPI0017E8F085|nr:DUF2829 domain-containing protein [Variovorax sp. SG517]NVM91087.1 hypothetical protein [Variovorax sp. SG517]